MNRGQESCRFLAVAKEIHEEFVNLEGKKSSLSFRRAQLVSSFGLAWFFLSYGWQRLLETFFGEYDFLLLHLAVVSSFNGPKAKYLYVFEAVTDEQNN